MPSEPPPLPQKPAGFWLRLVASIIDTILIMILTWPLLVWIYGTEYFTASGFIKGPADFIISYVVPAIAVIILWVKCRGTPGKLLLGLRVVDATTGGTMDLLQSVIRYFSYFISMLPLGFGFLWIAFDSKKQGFHDKIAKTLVVKLKN
ncbi:MAG TPA: RDD family protein [Chthoniobacterales bacterium]|nr:RDD family protein [Chthoniobacterales bacterium]